MLILLVFFLLFVNTANIINLFYANAVETNTLNVNASNKLEHQINKSNLILKNITRTLNENNLDYKKQIETLENVSSSLQDIGQTLKQTNTLLEQIDNSTMISFGLSQKFENIRSQTAIISGIEAALIGAATALIGERYIAKRIQKQQINKTRELINDDMSRIYKNVNEILLQIHFLHSQLNNSQNIQQRILQTGGIVDENIARILVNFRLLHWDAIVSGGYLIKLETNEIRILQSLYNYLEDTRKNSIDAYNTFTDTIVRINSSNTTPQTKLTDITTQLQNIATYFHLTYPKIIQRILRIPSEINWIKLEH